MTRCITINPHETIILSLPHTHHTVQIPTLEEGIKEKVVLCLPMLSAEGSICELHIIWGFDVIIRKAEGFIIPCIICVLISRSKVA